MAAADVRDVLERKSRLRAVFKVKAVRKEVICENEVSNLMHLDVMGLTPSTPGPQQGFLLMSRVSRVVLYFWSHVRDTDYRYQVQLTRASAMLTSPSTPTRLSARLRILSVRFRLRTCEMYVTPFYRLCFQQNGSSNRCTESYPELIPSQVKRLQCTEPGQVIQCTDFVEQRSTRSSIPRSGLRSIDNLPRGRLIRVR